MTAVAEHKTSPAVNGAIIREPSAADRDPVKHTRRRRTIELSLAIVFPIVIFVLWQLGSVNGWWDRVLYPAPSDIYRRTIERFENAKLWDHITATLYRVAWGFFWGVVSGLAAAFVFGSVRWLRKMTEPTLNALYTVPKITLISPFLIIFGFKDTPIILLIAISVFFFVWIPIQHAVMTVAPSQREAASSFGANFWQEFRHVTLPSTLPQIFVQLRVGASVALLTVFGLEAVYTPRQRGLGYFIFQTRNDLDTKSAYGGIIIAALLGVIIAAIIGRVGRVLTPWSNEDSARSAN